MKRLLILFIPLLLVSCVAHPSDTTEYKQTDACEQTTLYTETTVNDTTTEAIPDTTETNEPETTAAEVTEAPKAFGGIGLYVLYDGARSLVGSDYTAGFTPGRDIECFELFPTEEQKLGGGNFGKIWDKYDDRLPQAYKIGYSVEFEADGERYYSRIDSPEDTMRFSEYFEIYIYDDIHQTPGSRYSHLTKMNSDTLITSIKLTAAKKIEAVDTITVTVFIYDETEIIAKNTVAVHR